MIAVRVRYNDFVDVIGAHSSGLFDSVSQRGGGAAARGTRG